MAEFPNESERKAFLEKLGNFRSTLPVSEQRMLDAMAAAAFTPRDQGDVQGYAMWVAGPYGPTLQPTWIQTGWSYGWVNTGFGVVWGQIPTGYWG